MTCVACYCHFQAWGPGKTPSAGKESGLNGMPTGRAVATIHTWNERLGSCLDLQSSVGSV